MRGRGLWSLIAVLAGCDTSGDRCGDGEAAVGVVCRPNEATLRVGYGFAPAAMFAGDFDGDGALDAAAASPATRTVTIAWGPERAEATTFSFNSEIAGLAGGDVNGDGRVDLVVALPTRDAVGVLVGMGGRGFERGEDVAVGAGPRAVLVADLDADGRGELITADVGDDAVSVVRGGAREAVKVGAGPRALAAGDFDGDGVMDVAVALTDTAEVQVLRGGSSPGARVKVGAGPLAIVAVDVDGDGVDELATADALADTVSVIDGEVVRAWPVPARPRGLVVMKGDGAPGIAVLSEGTGEVSRLDPRSGAVASTSAAATALAAGDERDPLVVGAASGTAVVRSGEADGQVLTRAWSVEAWLGVHTPFDVDGDGRDELIVDSDSLLGLLLVSGVDGGVIGGQIAVPEFEQERVLVGGDVDGDARADIVVVGRVDGDPAVLSLLQRDDGTFAAGEVWTADGARAVAPALADLDGDGALDLLVGVEDDSETAVWRLAGDGAGGWTADDAPVLVQSGPLVAIEVVDLDGSAALDAVAFFEGTAEPLVLMYDPSEAGTTLPRGLSPEHRRVTAFAAGRLRKGDIDALLCGPRGVTRVRDVAFIVLVTETLTDEMCHAVVVRDGDGDGADDVFAYTTAQPTMAVDPTAGPFGGAAVSMWRDDGAGELTLVSRQAVPEGWKEFVFAELDGAMPLDVVSTDELLTTGLRGSLGPVLLAEPAVVVADAGAGRFADLDGDGVLDRVQVGSGIATALATGDGGFAPWRSAPLAGLWDEDVRTVVDVAVGDVDGDGADEVIVMGTIDLGSGLRAVSVIDVDADGPRGGTVARLSSDADQVHVADLDGDGRAEILVTDPGQVDESRVTLLRADDGYLARMQMVDIAGFQARFGLYDVQGDGILDLVGVVRGLGEAPDTLSVARGQGDGGFREASVWGALGGYAEFWLRDVDGDRAVDAVVRRGTALNSEVVVLRGGRDGRASGSARRLIEDVDTLTFADLDGDGVVELIAALAYAGDFPVSLTIGRHAGDGSYVLTKRLLLETGAASTVLELRAHDWDGDGRPDIAVVDAAGFTIVRQVP